MKSIACHGHGYGRGLDVARVGIWWLLAIVIGATASASYAQQGPPAFPVTFAPPVEKRITNWDEYSGRFEAVSSVDIRARVSGFIDKVHFKDGQIVQVGDLLFTLDKRSFQLAVESATAEVARADAQVEVTGADVDRAEPLVKSRTISGQAFDQRRANLAVAQASKQSAEAALKTAKLNLEWTEVRAPIAGRISDKRVDVGTLISGGGSSPSPTLLTTIVSLDPIHFVFDVSESDFLRYSRMFLSGERASSRDAANPVRIRLADEKDWPHVGKMDFVDNQLSVRSGTLRGRAVVDNTKQLLQPGLFGRLQLFGGEADALLIPDSSVVSDQARKIVFVVGKDDVVEARPVILGPLVDGLRVVREGIDKQTKIIIEGLANPAVRPGTKIAPTAGTIKSAAVK
ncbi:MAG: efflux RND transporter periplasmic adaptor subunit [Hyphomicrobiaceae bacterium]|nr:efflux RND transporter periplasmic adaptor subunit [Hyphomicrobiaceae bacterium]